MILVLLFSFRINFGLEGKIPSDLKLVDPAFSVRVYGTKSHFMNSHWIFLFSRVETTWAPRGRTGVEILVQTRLAVAGTEEGSDSGCCSYLPPGLCLRASQSE